MATFFICPKKFSAAAVASEINFLASSEAGDGVLIQNGIPKFKISYLLSSAGKETGGISPRDAHIYCVPSREQVLAVLRGMRTELSGLKNLAVERMIKALEGQKNKKKAA